VRRLLRLLIIAPLAGCFCQHPPARYAPPPAHYPVPLPGSPDLI